MKQDLLDKWLNGDISPSEMEELKQNPIFLEYLKIDAAVKQIETPSQDVSEGLKALKEKYLPHQKPGVIKLAPYLKIVAAASIILFIGYYYISSLPENFNTQPAQTQLLKLPDGSGVTLNENSHLSFIKTNWDNNRSITLEGEAYFEVKKGTAFDVLTTNGIVSVLGTKFNIYDRGNSFKVVCFEGLVGVTQSNNYVELSPGDKVYLENGLLVLDKKYTTQPGWITNESSFKNVKILAVLDELKSVYAINVITENIDVDLRYTGSFTNRDLDAALQTITLPLGLNYILENKNVTIYAKD
jgi:transmembrane sensor